MAQIDPRIALLAQKMKSRLELERSLGVNYLHLAPAAAEEVSLPAVPAVHVPASPPETVAMPTPALIKLPPLPEDLSDRSSVLTPVREIALDCHNCGLCEMRTNVVFGEGSLDADLVFIGEAPGRDEDEEGRPFVGRAGKLLTDIIEKGMKMQRDSVYICNIVKCRPPGNRDPKPDEVTACLPYLHQQIAVIRPKVIVALGRIAGNILTEQNVSMGNLRGAWWSYDGIPLRAIYHPAYLLRERKKADGKSRADRVTWEDLKEVMGKLG